MRALLRISPLNAGRCCILGANAWVLALVDNDGAQLYWFLYRMVLINTDWWIRRLYIRGIYIQEIACCWMERWL